MISRLIFTKSPDYDTLRHFFSETGGRGKWLDRTGWKRNRRLVGWRGVELNGDGRVRELLLKRNGCTGHIPSTIGDLTALVELYLGENHLTGSIPPTLGGLSVLSKLDLARNKLSGSIPPQLGNLSQLTLLQLFENELTGVIPLNLGDLEALKTLSLSENNLSGPIPSTIGNLKALTELHLWRNKLTGDIPSTLGDLSELQMLALSINELSGSIPSTIGNLTTLFELHLWGNNLTGYIPSTLGDLSVLQILDLSKNKLSGSIPPALGGLSALLKLDLSRNMLSGSIPPQIGNLYHLTVLQLFDNELTGVIPPKLGDLTALETLSLSNNKLSGRMGRRLGGRDSLDGADIRPPIDGTTLPQIENLLDLDVPRLEGNELTGSIPPALGHLSALVTLDLSSNKLSGLISLRRFDCDQLDGFVVSGGPLPEESINKWRRRLTRLQLLERVVLQDQDAVRTPPSSTPSEWEKPRVDPDARVSGTSATAMENLQVTALPLSGQDDRAEMSLQSQVALIAEQHGLTSENHSKLDEISQHVVMQTGDPENSSAQAETLRELDRLIQMAKYLEETVASNVEDGDMQRRERNLIRGSMREAHFTTLRTGLCKAYLASCVIGSKLVSTCKTGAMGTVGKALALVAGVAPVVGGLASLAGAALEAGDHYVQTQRIMKIADIAPDVVECSRLSKRVAMKITEGFRDDDFKREARVEKGAGHVGPTPFDDPGQGQEVGGLENGADADSVLDWFAQEIVNDTSDFGPDTTRVNPAAMSGRRHGEKHLRMLLRAIGRDILRNTTDLDAKVVVLVRVVLRNFMLETDIPGMEDLEQSPAKMGRSYRYGAVSQSDVEMLMARMEIMESREAEHGAEIETLKRQNSDLRKKITELEDNGKDEETRGAVDAGGGQLFANRKVRQRERIENFWPRVEEQGSVNDRGSMAPDEFEKFVREDMAIQQDEWEMMNGRISRLEAYMEKKETKIAYGRK